MTGSFVPTALHLIRPRQWVKNLFLFAPLFFDAKMTSWALYPTLLAGFASFCLAASSVYVLNDICDAEADRHHQKKKLRPIASGAVSPIVAGGLGVALLAGAVLIPALAGLPPAFYTALGAYLLVNVVYSLGLKHVAVLELALVSSGFVLRLLAGGVVAHIPLSPWIIVATGMISFLLTAGKRRADLALNNDPERRRRSLARYTVEYLDAVVAASAGGAIIVYLLFCASDYATQRYGRALLLTSVPVALGVLRFVQIVMVESGGENPTDIVMRDRFILATIGAFMLIFGIIIYA